MLMGVSGYAHQTNNTDHPCQRWLTPTSHFFPDMYVPSKVVFLYSFQRLLKKWKFYRL